MCRFASFVFNNILGATFIFNIFFAELYLILITNP
jgi:hypothetical protein